MSEDHHVCAGAASGPSPGAPGAAGSASAADGADRTVPSTREALVRAALDLFGRTGYDGTSTRDIARAAGVNIAGIAYHFGGKAGLHRACGDMIAATVAGLFPGETEMVPADASPEAATAAFLGIVARFAGFLLARPEAETIARFMVREQMDPTPTFEALYGPLIRPRHEGLCRLWAQATGDDPANLDVSIAVSAVIGQIVFFRVGRATALRRLGWSEVDAAGLARILAVVGASIVATIAARRAAAGRPPLLSAADLLGARHP